LIDWHCKNVNKILLSSKYSLSFAQWRLGVPSVLSVPSCLGTPNKPVPVGKLARALVSFKRPLVAIEL